MMKDVTEMTQHMRHRQRIEQRVNKEMQLIFHPGIQGFLRTKK